MTCGRASRSSVHTRWHFLTLMMASLFSGTLCPLGGTLVLEVVSAGHRTGPFLGTADRLFNPAVRLCGLLAALGSSGLFRLVFLGLPLRVHTLTADDLADFFFDGTSELMNCIRHGDSECVG